LNTSAEPVLEGMEEAKGVTHPRGSSGSGKRRRRSREPEAPARYFLGKPGTNGLPVLEKEYSTEGEVMIESLKNSQSYFVVLEWQATADLSKAMPQIRRKAVKKPSS